VRTTISISPVFSCAIERPEKASATITSTTMVEMRRAERMRRIMGRG